MGKGILSLLPSAPTAGQTAKAITFRSRIAELKGHGTWIHFPGRGLWQDTVPGICSGKWNPTGKPIFVMSLAVFEREIMAMTVGEWTRFLAWHPPTVRKFHAHFNEADPEGGITDAGHFAVSVDEKVG